MSSSYLSRVAKLIEEALRIPMLFIDGASRSRVLYTSTEQGASNLWVLERDGSRKLVVDEPVAEVSLLRRDERYVLYSIDVARGAELHRVKALDMESLERLEEVAEGLPLGRVFGLAVRGSTAVATLATREGVYLYRAEVGGKWERIAELKAMFLLTDASDRYAVGFGPLRGDPKSMEIGIVDLQSGELRIYTPKPGSRNLTPTIEGTKIMFESDFEGRNRLYIYDVASEKLERYDPGGDYARYDPAEHTFYGWRDGSVWVVAKKNGRCALFIDGRLVYDPRGTIHGIPAFLGNELYLAISSLSRPPRIVRVRNGVEETIIAPPRTELEESIAEVRFVKYRSFDGLEAPMYVVLSSRAPRPGPALVLVHGGPWSEVADVWSITIPVLAALGIHVLAPNFRGSTGYGAEYMMKIVGNPGGGDLEDVVYAARWAIENGIADPKKIAVGGYSYGGYATYMAMVRHPEVWRCGVAGAGIVDWEEMYELSDALFRQFIDALFAGRKDLLRERSPIHYVDNLRAPICIIHPQNDSRCPLKPVLRFVSALLEKGKRFELHVAPDMGHAVTKLEDAVKILLPYALFLYRCLYTESE